MSQTTYILGAGKVIVLTAVGEIPGQGVTLPYIAYRNRTSSDPAVNSEELTVEAFKADPTTSYFAFENSEALFAMIRRLSSLGELVMQDMAASRMGQRPEPEEESGGTQD